MSADLADPEKLREIADSWRRVSDSPRDCFSEFSDHLDAAADRIASQAAEIAELRERAALLNGILDSLYQEMGYEGSGGPLMHLQELKASITAQWHNEIRASKTVQDALAGQLAAAEAERDKMRLDLEAIRGCLFRWRNRVDSSAKHRVTIQDICRILDEGPTP